MENKQIIAMTEEFARTRLGNHDSGHDWWHLHRVRNTALAIHKAEGQGDPLVIEISALLHDIGDSKFISDKKEDISGMIARFLTGISLSDKEIKEIIFINHNISFSKGKRPDNVSAEFMIVQDSDRLDAIGAVGIARAFNYGGFRNNRIYDPTGREPSTIGHFYDKLLRLKDMMNTTNGRKIAAERQKYMELFLERFYDEWDGLA